MVYFWNWAKGLIIIEVKAVLRWQKLNHASCQNVFITSSNSMVHPSSSWGLQSVTHINRKIHAIIRLPRRFSGVQYKYFNPLLFSNHLLGAKIEVVDLYLFSNWWPIWGLVCSAVQCSVLRRWTISALLSMTSTKEYINTNLNCKWHIGTLDWNLDKFILLGWF